MRSPYKTATKALLAIAFLISSGRYDQGFVAGCGTSVHGEIAYRASQLLSASGGTSGAAAAGGGIVGSSRRVRRQETIAQDVPVHAFEKLIRERQDLLLAGSFFPDWGYNCIGLKWNGAAEDAHWPPFVESALKYMFNTYHDPWTDPRATQIVAFLFGIVAHSLSDLSWHSLHGLQEGFIQVQADTSFHGNFTRAHKLADDGGDFVLSHMRKLDHLVTDWTVPVKDVLAIYQLRNFTIPENELVQCLVKGYAGSQAKARLDPPLFDLYAVQTPFLAEQVEEHPMGGFYDMTEWTLQCWNGLAGYLTKDPSANLTSPEKPFNLCDELMDDKIGRPTTLTQPTTQKRRLQRRQGEHFQCQQQHQHLVRRQDEIPQPGLEDLEKAGLTVHTETDPNTGAVTFSVQKSNPSQTSPAPQQAEIPSPKSKRDDTPCPSINDNTNGAGVGTLFLPQVYASLGHAVVAGDFDGDGVQELVISAPHFTRDVLVPSQGAVFITPSKALSSLSGSTSNIQTLASQTLHGDPAEPQSRFGYSLAVVDLNQDGIDDLAVGAPGTGAKDINYDGSVHVYFGVRGQGLGSNPDLKIGYDRTKRVIPAGLNVLTGIGRTLLGVDLTGSGHKDLVIGMPMATTINPSSNATTDPSNRYQLQAGRVLGFLGSSHHVGSKLDTDADWQLQGDTRFGWFGASIAAVKASITGPNGTVASPQNVLVVGSPSFASGVDTAMVGNIQGYSSDKIPQKLFAVHGMSSFQQFGSGLVALKEDGLLAVGSISESPDGSSWQAGVLRVINVSLIKSGTDSKLSDLVPTVVVGSPLNGSQKTAQLSSALAASSGGTNGQSLWVSEPFVNGEDGRIIQWETSGTGGIKQCFRGEQNSRSRLGTRILATDLNGDGKEDLVVAASHDSRYADLSGTVTIRFGV